ncbi:MAG: glycosyltransferase [Candidatus Dojkabacteria bacterium]
MKIAVISSNTLSTPPDPSTLKPGWGVSMHDVVSTITEGLVARGHDVTLFASGDTKTTAKLEYVWEKASVNYEVHTDQFDGLYMTYDNVLASYCFQKNLTERYDIIYTYHVFDSGIFGFLTDTPIISTLHGIRGDHEAVVVPKIIKPNYYVSISQFQIKSMDYLKVTECIPNGIDKDLFNFSPESGNSLVFVGRITTDKGTDIAIQVAGKMDLELDILGETNYKPLQDQVEELAKGHKINFHGNIPKQNVGDIVSKSKAFIFPIRWDEPFGLVLAESLACGTPIIGFANGSMPEIVEDGKTGFLVNMDGEHIRGDWIVKKTGAEGLEEALNKLYSLSDEDYAQMRKDCRETFEKKFTKEMMIDRYEELFEKIVKKEIE